MEQVLFDLLRSRVTGETVNKHISNYLNSNDAADKICGRLLSTNSFTAPIDAFIQHRPRKALAADRVVTEME